MNKKIDDMIIGAFGVVIMAMLCLLALKWVLKLK